jgi:plasmid stability protein
LHSSEVIGMATLMIRDLDDAVKARLRVRAAHNGRSMEAEARAILRAALAEPATRRGLGSRIRQRFADLEDEAITPPPRAEQPRAADFAP